MPEIIYNISLFEANQIIESIINKAVSDGGGPVAVAVVDSAGRLKAFSAMDGVMPASVKLSQSKAYSAVIGQRDTLHWASIAKNKDAVDFDMRNWTDENFSGFTGGVVITHQGKLIGGVGVSGRKGKMSDSDTVFQDNELAGYGKTNWNIESN